MAVYSAFPIDWQCRDDEHKREREDEVKLSRSARYPSGTVNKACMSCRHLNHGYASQPDVLNITKRLKMELGGTWNESHTLHKRRTRRASVLVRGNHCKH